MHFSMSSGILFKIEAANSQLSEAFNWILFLSIFRYTRVAFFSFRESRFMALKFIPLKFLTNLLLISVQQESPVAKKTRVRNFMQSIGSSRLCNL